MKVPVEAPMMVELIVNQSVVLLVPILVWLKGTVVLFAITVVAGPVASTIVLFSILDKSPVSEVNV